MKPSTFVARRQLSWNNLQSHVSKAQTKGIRRLTESELHELIRLYPAVTVDVARSRRYNLDSATQRDLNQLAISAHGLLYRSEHRSFWPAVKSFFRADFPVLFRRNLATFFLAVLILFMGFLGTYTATRLNPDKAYRFIPAGVDLPSTERGLTANDMSQRFRRLPHPPMAAGVITNNLAVAINAFALGITAGIGTCYILLMNSMLLGGMAAHFANHGLSYPFWAFITPHGILEILAIIIAAAAGLRMGLALAVPGGVSRLQSLRQGASEAVLLLVGTIPMFVVAGVVEGFITPSTFPGGGKIVLGTLLGGGALLYLFTAGRNSRSPTEHAQPTEG